MSTLPHPARAVADSRTAAPTAPSKSPMSLNAACHFDFDTASPPCKRWAPPGWELSTSITSHGLRASEIVVVDGCRCQTHRQRYPEVEAIIQMFFRVWGIVLGVVVLIIVRLLDTQSQEVVMVERLYGGVSRVWML